MFKFEFVYGIINLNINKAVTELIIIIKMPCRKKGGQGLDHTNEKKGRDMRKERKPRDYKKAKIDLNKVTVPAMRAIP